MTNTTQAPRPAAVDLDAAARRAEELDHVDSRWTHTDAPYEWDVGAVIRALAADLAATRAERDAARATVREWIAANGPGGWIDDLRKERDAALAALPDAELVEEYAASVPYQQGTADWLRRLAAAIRAQNVALMKEVGR